MAAYDYARETYAEAVGSIRPLLLEHWRELATYGDVPLDPDFEAYRVLDAAGVLRIFTVRIASDLVGYAIYFVRSGHVHYRSTPWAVSDIVLVRREHRNLGVGNGLFEFIERSLAEEGVRVISTMAKLAHPELSLLLEARGHARNEVIHVRRL